MPFIIRLAVPEDAPAIHVITQEAWEEYRHLPGSSSALYETEEHVRSLLLTDENRAAIGFLDSEGVVCVRFQLTDHLYFSRLAVHPAHQGRGFARAMLYWLEDLARAHGLRESRCTVRGSIMRNVRLYESSGYSKIGERVVPSQSGDVELAVWTMAKTLA